MLAYSAFSASITAVDALRQQIFFRSSTDGTTDVCFNVAFFFKYSGVGACTCDWPWIVQLEPE